MTYRVLQTGSFTKSLRKLDRPVAHRIVKFLNERIDDSEDPRQTGQALEGARLGNLWRYRVGDYRIIVDIRDDELIVLALHATHRGSTYSDSR